MKIYLCAVLVIMFCSCQSKNKVLKEIIKVDTHWLDSVKKTSDTSWSKKYRSLEFYNADYYVTKKDSIATQVMTDSLGNVRQVLSAKYDQVRVFFAQYYANGQLMARLSFDSLGKYNGVATLFYETGIIKSLGSYAHGFYTGQWKNYDSTGNYTNTDVYNADGQLVQ